MIIKDNFSKLTNISKHSGCIAFFTNEKFEITHLKKYFNSSEHKNLNALLNQFAQYEICFGNQFNVKSEGLNIKSTGFNISGVSETVFLTDTPNADKQTGVVSIVKKDIVDGQKIIIVENAGTVDYIKGEINLTTINITSTDKPNNIIEIQAFPESNDVIGLEDLYLKFNIESSSINMIKDTISSGDQISGVGFKVTSSYTNGDLIRG